MLLGPVEPFEQAFVTAGDLGDDRDCFVERDRPDIPALVAWIAVHTGTPHTHFFILARATSQP